MRRRRRRAERAPGPRNRASRRISSVSGARHRQMQVLTQNLLHAVGGERLFPRGVAVREAIRVVNRNQIRLGAVGPDIPRGFRHSPAARREVRVRQRAVVLQDLAARGAARPDRGRSRRRLPLCGSRKTWQCVSEQKSNPAPRWRPCHRSAQVRARIAMAWRAAGASSTEASPRRTPETYDSKSTRVMTCNPAPVKVTRAFRIRKVCGGSLARRRMWEQGETAWRNQP